MITKYFQANIRVTIGYIMWLCFTSRYVVSKIPSLLSFQAKVPSSSVVRFYQVASCRGYSVLVTGRTLWRRVGVSLVKTGTSLSLSKLKWLSFSTLLIKPDLSYTVEPSSGSYSKSSPPVPSPQSILSHLRDLLCALCRSLVTLSLLTPLLLTYPVLPGRFWNRYL